MNVVKKLEEKLMRTATKITKRFRRGDHEKGFIGAGAGAALIAIGGTGYLGNTIDNMVGSLTGSSGTSSTTSTNIGGFVNDVVLLIGIISIILGIVEYRRVRKLLRK
ncbi:hypothetical protein [Saccharolobus shibatae]|uniref:Uncharacterized protein n=1 Tax=Saccharolobus shibatae TaxID=2286 RepID=A0A8F5BRX8_9CREN|nr:hypothetical protein [Saccharolobus shibatae]QXJ30342.1 hypothetical protein J5U21_p0084 [Saccharolobus shibatae]QXJ30444.1 hypothetical protein J5U21_00084 [Saccharolobus shibatae]